MELVQDARYSETGSNHTINFGHGRVTAEVLMEIVNDLEDRDIVSIIFLMVDENTDFPKVSEILKKDPRAEFLRIYNKYQWTEKLLESLIVSGNKCIVRKMGYNKHEIQTMENAFVSKVHNVSPHLNRAIKSLYFLCEYLDQNEVENLVSKINDELTNPLPLNNTRLYLEIYILEWLHQKYISINTNNFNLLKLTKNIKSIGCLYDLPFNFDYWEGYDNKNKQDSQITGQTSNSENTSQYSTNEDSHICNDLNVKWSTPDHLKLCIIVNIIDFTDKKKYESREGSEVDEKKLEETFEGCGFKIEKHRNYKREKMMKLLESLNTQSYSIYGAIFMCILSHGFKGEVIFSDDETISTETIRDKFCCRKLRKVFKFLILQSCQGKQIGLSEKQLVTDGPSNLMDPLPRMHFGLFQATIEDFAAMRHKKEGSWFIQAICDEIKEANKPIEIVQFIRNVKKRVTSKRASYSDYKFLDIVQVPISTDTITIPYEIPKFQNRRLER